MARGWTSVPASDGIGYRSVAGHGLENIRHEFLQQVGNSESKKGYKGVTKEGKHNQARSHEGVMQKPARKSTEAKKSLSFGSDHTTLRFHLSKGNFLQKLKYWLTSVRWNDG